MKFVKLFIFLTFAFACSVCAKEKKVGTVADTTAECVFMKEICDYALELQQEYNAMPETDDDERQQKREMIQVLNGTIAKCEKARNECTKSVKKAK
ncbi:MAG: hypothetical protein FWF51_08710 [Chitinivibrionia bacterium]|jgi:hypothetical protein|nr:hypothetical protein [Chitinivibrionia bacterium]